MSDGDYKLVCLLATAAGVDPDKMTKVQFRKFYADALVSQKIAEAEAARLFEQWSSKG